MTLKEFETLGAQDARRTPQFVEQVLENIREEYGSQSKQAAAYAKGAGL